MKARKKTLSLLISAVLGTGHRQLAIGCCGTKY